MKVQYLKLAVKDLTLSIAHKSDNDTEWKSEVVVDNVIDLQFCSDCVIKDKLRKIYGNDIEIEEIKNG